MKKKVTARKTSRSRAQRVDNSFLIIVGGGGFIVVTLMLFFSGLLPFSLNLLDVSQRSASQTTLGATTKQQVATVTIQNNTFTPQKLLIQKGTEVIWINNGDVSAAAVASDGSFDTGAVLPGESKSVVFNQGGIYPYHSGADQTASGVILVLQ